jgi:hypothetical protein
MQTYHPEKLATLGTQDIRGRQTKKKHKKKQCKNKTLMQTYHQYGVGLGPEL